VPAARDDDTYRVELANMAAVWLFSCLAWRLDGALKDDARWGIWSIRGRLIWYLEAVIAMTASAGVLPGINEAAAALARCRAAPALSGICKERSVAKHHALC
jgi:hypothetical protein